MNDHYKLSIPNLPIKLESIDWPTSEEKNKIWRVTPAEFLHPILISYFDTIQLPISGVMMFWRSSGYSNTHAHIDFRSTDPDSIVYCGINYVVGGIGSEMVWYEAPNKSMVSALTEARTNFTSERIDHLIEKSRGCIGNELTLVRTDLPHAIMMKTEPRLCISIRLQERFSSWESAVHKFTNLGLI